MAVFRKRKMKKILFLMCLTSLPFLLWAKGGMKRQKTSKAGIQMAYTVEEMRDWNRYPTYQTYLDLMYGLARTYPTLCRLDTIGLSTKGRLILCLKISDNVHEEEAEPGFFYSSSIHGDELTGFVLMLRLADYLLTRYGTDPEVTALVDGMQIYINPLSNPDGAYAASDNDVSGATRENAGRVDLNRNYPDAWRGAPATIQKENKAMMAYAMKNDWVMSANIHGGSDVLNFPWDGFRSSSKKHADFDWWEQVCKRYVDSCRRVDARAYRDVNDKGYVHGGDWYVVNHGRQDYMNAFGHVREQTIEISFTKMPPSSELPRYWEINGRSLLNYMKEAGYGIQGRVRDSLSGDWVRALVTVLGHDRDSSQVYSSSLHGAFFRPIAAGSYDLLFSAPGYKDKVVTGVKVDDFSVTCRHVSLMPDSLPAVADTTTVPFPPDTLAGEGAIAWRPCSVYPNPVQDVLNVEAGEAFSISGIYDVAGREVRGIVAPEVFSTCAEVQVSGLPSGLYFLEVRDVPGQRVRRVKFIKR